MTLPRVLFATACAGLVGLLSTGCTGILEPRGGGGGGGGGGPDAGPLPDANLGNTPQALFVSTVRDRLGTTCVPCHVDGGTQSPYFLAKTADNYYNFLMAGYPNDWIGTSPEESVVYTKGLSPHAGSIVWDATDQGYIYDWIVAEYEDRSGGGGGTPVPDPDAANCAGDPTQCALENFAKCFQYGDWSAKEINQIANVQSATGQCKVCHSTGTGGFYTSDDSLTTYQRWKESGYIEGIVEGALDQGQFAGLVASYAIEEKGADPNHPSYTLDATYVENLNAFVQDTLTSFGAGPCVDDPGQ
jgi:hypothetical protein